MQRVFPARPRTWSAALRALLVAPHFWLPVLLLLAWTLRLAHLGTMSIWWDESLSWDRALQDLPTILSNTIRIQNVITHDLHPPLYFVLLHFAVLLVGTTEFALRFASTCANLLTLAMLYPLARLLFGARSKPVGMLTALLAALSPFYVWYSQEARPYALVLLCSVFTLYALLRWLKTNPQRFFNLRSRWAILFVIGLGATLATHYLSFVLLPFFAGTLLLFGDRGRRWRERAASPITLTAAALCGIFAAIFIFIPSGAEQLTGSDYGSAQFVPFFIMLRDVWNSFAVGLTANLDQVAWLDLFLVGLWYVGIFSTIRARARDARLALFLVTYLLLPAIALQLGSYLRPLYLNSRHLITTSPAFYFGLALGIDALARRVALIRRFSPYHPLTLSPRQPLILYSVVTCIIAIPLLVGSVYSLDNLYLDTTYAKDDHKGWAQFLRENMRPDDYLILVAPQAEKIVEYYIPPGLQWESLPHLGQTRDWQEYLDRESVLKAYRNHGRVWFLEIHEPVADPQQHIADLLRRFGTSVDIVYFSGISTQLVLQQFVYGTPQQKNVPIPNPQNVVFDNNLNLVGYRTPAQIQAGQQLTALLYWRLKNRTARDVSVSLRVVDDKGNIWGEADAPPVGNLYPMSKWPPKTTLLDRHALGVNPGTPPGNYTVELSVSQSPGHELLPVRADNVNNHAVRLASIQVTRPNPPLDPRNLVMDGHADVAFGDAVRFVGYDAPEPLANPGSLIPLTLYFQVGQGAGRVLNGQLELTAPWWQFWNQTRTVAPFSLDLSAHQTGDLAQVQLGARVPGDANAGEYELHLALEGLTPAGLPPTNDVAFGRVNVESLARSTDLPLIANPMNARLGDSIEFLGYALDAKQPLTGGDRVKLTLYWRALKTMDTSYTVFTHLLNRDNKIYGQQDRLPLAGARPTTSWAPGEIFVDEYEFDVAPDAPAGTYQIEIGMYNSADAKRLSVFDANGNPIGDRILFPELRVQ